MHGVTISARTDGAQSKRIQAIEGWMYIYRFLSGDDDSSFCHKVSKALTEGWILHGSSHYQFDAATQKMRCAQAVTKEVEDQVYDPDKKLTAYE